MIECFTGAEVIVFDMDGVLVDVSDSYRETIVKTVHSFTRETISRDAIQDYKNQGGWNNDWLLTQKICGDLGKPVEYDAVVKRFNHFFIDQRYVDRERWIARPGLLEDLADRADLAIFTGRSKAEVKITLEREGWTDRFLVVASDEVKHQKPHPEGLVKIASLRPEKKMIYLGDTVDDARASRAAGVPFVGIAGPESPRREELIALLTEEGAVVVLGSINEIC